MFLSKLKNKTNPRKKSDDGVPLEMLSHKDFEGFVRNQTESCFTHDASKNDLHAINNIPKCFLVPLEPALQLIQTYYSTQENFEKITLYSMQRAGLAPAIEDKLHFVIDLSCCIHFSCNEPEVKQLLIDATDGSALDGQAYGNKVMGPEDDNDVEHIDFGKIAQEVIHAFWQKIPKERLENFHRPTIENILGYN